MRPSPARRRRIALEPVPASTRQAPGETLEGTTPEPAMRRSLTRASLSARSVLTRKEAGAVSLLARAKAAASSSPKAAAQRATSQAGGDVSTESFSGGAAVTDGGSEA